MLTTLPAFASVEHFFAGLVQAPTPECFDARLIPGVARILPLDELRDLLKTERLDTDTTDAVWRQLARHAREWGEPWTTIATGIALPGLTHMARKIRHAARARFDEDVASEMMAAFLDALRTADLAAPRLWLRLCWPAWRAGVRATRTEQASELPDDVPAGSRTPTLPYGHPDLLLGRAVAAGVITQQAADIISATRLDHVLLAQLAAEQNVSPAVLRRRRRQWEADLVDALRQGLLTVTRPTRTTAEHRPDSPVRTPVRSTPLPLTGIAGTDWRREQTGLASAAGR
jgi:hypothetical protein